MRLHRLEAGLLFVALLVTACDRTGEAEYIPPEPGTIYHYRGGFNRITGNAGMRTFFEDSAGGKGARAGLFLPDNPDAPIKVDSAALAALWPLTVGSEATVRTERGPEVWNWEFRVTGIEAVDVPIGSYDAFVVQAVESPELIRDPRYAYSASYQWWYSPKLNAVVKFRVTYLSGPVQGRVVTSELVDITTPDR
jgi:hypothetical protein